MSRDCHISRRLEAGVTNGAARFDGQVEGAALLSLGQIEGAGVGNAGFGGVAAFDAANVEEFFAAAFQVGFHFGDVGGRNDKNHADAEVEGFEQAVGVHVSDFGEVFVNREDGPGGEIDDGFDAGGQNAREIAGDAAAGDVGECGKPTFGENIF